MEKAVEIRVIINSSSVRGITKDTIEAGISDSTDISSVSEYNSVRDEDEKEVLDEIIDSDINDDFVVNDPIDPIQNQILSDTNGKAPYFRAINGFLSNCTHTNIVFTAVSYSYVDHKHIQLMYKFNSRLSDYANALSRYAVGTVACIDMNDANGFVHKKHIITDKLLYFTQHEVKNSNLIFIKPFESSTENQVELNVEPVEVEVLESTKHCEFFLETNLGEVMQT
ncbi:unnamed protein product [Ceutorhynchus assimilis]|uniref:Uncharacterized protein n=1 Tax=Ceutorhynchus assimilis TaxID=467358 RepID=A0A9N9M921_9CUCU|nr:unnamed protein product [Ceutorhynchus assimilis]